MERITCINQLTDLHRKLVSITPDKDTILPLCMQLDSSQGISSQRLTNAMENCDPNEFDKPDYFTPADTSDVGRLAHKLCLFPDDFMNRLRLLTEKVSTPCQKNYGNLISNLPLAIYLCLFQKIAKNELSAIIDEAVKGSSTCQLVLTVPGLIQYHEWVTTTREWNRQNVNREETGDDTDKFIRLLAPTADRFDVRSVFGNDFLHSFLATKIKVLMSQKIGSNWLAFSGVGNSLRTPQISDRSVVDWQYGEVTPFSQEDATIKICLVLTLIDGNPRKLISLPPSYSLYQMKAVVEKELRELECQPCGFG